MLAARRRSKSFLANIPTVIPTSHPSKTTIAGNAPKPIPTRRLSESAIDRQTWTFIAVEKSVPRLSIDIVNITAVGKKEKSEPQSQNRQNQYDSVLPRHQSGSVPTIRSAKDSELYRPIIACDLAPKQNVFAKTNKSSQDKDLASLDTERVVVDLSDADHDETTIENEDEEREDDDLRFKIAQTTI